MRGRDWRGGEAVALAMEREGTRETPESPYTGHSFFAFKIFAGKRALPQK